MIPRTSPPAQPPRWREVLAGAIRDPEELLEVLGLAHDYLDGARLGADLFALRVPRGFVARMAHGDPSDPLLRQVLPLGEEAVEDPKFTTDPLQEREASAVPGILHKYRGRALLIVAGACPVHCRYCFRRDFPYSDHRLNDAALEEALDYLRAEESVEEVILSGGDPLVVSDERLAVLARNLAEIPHLRRLRVHSRTPITIPERIDDRLLEWLTASRLKPVMVVHANHPNEIDGAVTEAMQRLRRAGVPVLNQAVLLAGVNDDADVLVRLSHVLFEAGVLPYYLHLLDQVRGTTHFQVPGPRAKAIYASLLSKLPGYLVPKLVREIAGHASKVPIGLDLTPAEEDPSVDRPEQSLA